MITKTSMSSSSKKKKSAKNKTPTPAHHLSLGWVCPAACILLACGIIISLITFNHSDPSVWKDGPPFKGADIQNGFGLLGAVISSFLIRLFGLWAFWPAVDCLFFFWLRVTRRKIHSGMMIPGAGLMLFFFATLALFSLIWPSLPFLWPGEAGGGIFGKFLADGALNIAGKTGSFFILPALAFCGIFLVSGNLYHKLLSLFLKNYDNNDSSNPALSSRRKDSNKNLGLDEEPVAATCEAEAPQERAHPIIVDQKPSKTVKERKQSPGTIEPTPQPRKGPISAPYRLPDTALLDLPPEGMDGHSSGLSKEELLNNAKTLENKLRDFGVDGQVLEVSGGPVITMYEYRPAPGIKISKVAGLTDDLTMAMRATSIRVVAPLPGKAAIGIEIPNAKRSLVSFREVVESQAFQSSRSFLSLVLGVDIMGVPQVADLGKMPHLLIAGATGSGKSVGLGAMIMSILYKAPPDKVRFLMIDPKCVELALYKDIPHLIYPVLSDPTEATLGLKWAVAEMDVRYKLLAEKGVRNIEGYNDKVRAELKTWQRKKGDNGEEIEAPKELPFLVIIIDELADLMMVSAKEVEVYITRLAQKARAAGIHLILATQRPSVDVLTGIIKANMPTRISFQVSSRIDSRTILDQMGAEKLLGAGDMLYLPPGIGKLRRLHGAFVSDEEIKRVTDFVRQWGPPEYLEDLSLPEPEDDGIGGEKDEKYDDAVELVRRTQKASISHVQRHLRIGYNRAARIIEEMEREGIIGPQDGVRPRAIL